MHLFVRLIPPRPTFPTDMDDRERALMQEHVVYMKREFERGKVIVYGPVLAKAGAYGMAVLDVTDEAEARAILDADPTVRAKLNSYEVSPMRIAAARGV